MSPKLWQRFNFKKITLLLIPVILGAALGAGGTLGVQSFLKTNTVQKDEAPREEGPLVPIGEFTVNLKGNAFLRTELVVEGVEKKDGEFLSTREIFLKDRVNSVLSTKSLAEVATAEGREKLRSELVAELNKVASDKVYNVLFLSFVYQ